jgi:hypothetical protein
MRCSDFLSRGNTRGALSLFNVTTDGSSWDPSVTVPPVETSPWQWWDKSKASSASWALAGFASVVALRLWLFSAEDMVGMELIVVSSREGTLMMMETNAEQNFLARMSASLLGGIYRISEAMARETEIFDLSRGTDTLHVSRFVKTHVEEQYTTCSFPTTTVRTVCPRATVSPEEQAQNWPNSQDVQEGTSTSRHLR